MKTEKISTLKEPEKIVLDFLNYLEKETPIKFDMPTLIGVWAWVASKVNGIGISMPAEFYLVNLTNFPIVMYLRYCPCESCHKVVYVDLFMSSKGNEISNANTVMKYIKKAVPGMTVYISDKPDPKSIKNYIAEYYE
jgi:hypothetical protein